MTKFEGALILGIIALFVFAFFAGGCTSNQRAKAWGGDTQVVLPAGTKLVDVTWKMDNLWFLYRAADPDETPVTYTFAEDSSWGLMEGTVTFVESGFDE